MTFSTSFRTAGFAALALLLQPLFGQDPLARTYAAHGGLETWRAQGTLLYDLDVTYGEIHARDHQVFDLITRHGIASNTDYAVGFDGANFWLSRTGETSTPFPPRFYLWTPFYFLGVPFVFADEGAIRTELEPAMYQGKEYRVVRVTFASGVGDAPDDVYHLYIDPTTDRVKLLRYTVSYFVAAQGKPTDNLPENALLYDDWVETNAGLLMATRTVSYAWREGTTTGDPRVELDFANLRFLETRPDPARFVPPADAEMLP